MFLHAHATRKLQKVSDAEKELESPLSWRTLSKTFVKKKRLREKLTVLRPSPGLPCECAGARRPSHGAQRTANSARRTKHGAQAKNTTQLPVELVYVRVHTTKFNGLQLISWNGRRQLAIGLRLIYIYYIYIYIYIQIYIYIGIPSRV